MRPLHLVLLALLAPSVRAQPAATCPPAVVAACNTSATYWLAAQSCNDLSLACTNCLYSFTAPWVFAGVDANDAAILVACATALAPNFAPSLANASSISTFGIPALLRSCLLPSPPPPPPAPPGFVHYASSSSDVVRPANNESLAGAPPSVVSASSLDAPAYTTLAFAQSYAQQQIPLTTAAYLGGSLRCVDYQIARDNASSTGDGFSFLRTDTATGAATFADARKMAPGQTVTPLLSDMDGMNVWVLKNWATVANFSLSIDILRLSSNDFYSNDINVQFAASFSAGYDCVVTNSFLTYENLPFVLFADPPDPFAFRVVTNKAVTTPRSALYNVWVRTYVFSPSAWLVLAASLVCVGAAMWLVDGSHNDLEVVAEHRDRKTLHSVTTSVSFAVAGFTSKTDEFAPRSGAGAVLNVFSSFAALLIVAFFTANLAAILITGDPTTQPITSIASFAASHVPACIPDKLSYRSFMQLHYPTTPILAVAGPVAHLLAAVANGTCAGAVAPDLFLQSLMGPMSDPSGKYCGLELVGEPLAVGFFSVPFSQNIDYRALQALSIATLRLLDDGTYAAARAGYFPDPGTGRPQCPSKPSSTPGYPPPLTLQRLSGVFAVQAIGCVLASMLWCCSRARSRHRLLPELLCSQEAHVRARASYVHDGGPVERASRKQRATGGNLFTSSSEGEEAMLVAAKQGGGGAGALLDLAMDAEAAAARLRRAIAGGGAAGTGGEGAGAPHEHAIA